MIVTHIRNIINGQKINKNALEFIVFIEMTIVFELNCNNFELNVFYSIFSFAFYLNG